MSINIKMREQKWFIEVDNETWEVGDEKTLKKVMGELIDLKQKYVPKKT